MRKSLSIVAALVFTLAACYESPLNPTAAGPFGANLSGTWVLTSITGSQPPATPVVPAAPVAAGPLPFVTSAGSKTNGTTPKTQLDSAVMTMLYDLNKDWTQHLYFTRTDPVAGGIIVSDSVRRGQYYTTTDVNGVTSITMNQNTPYNAFYTGVQPLNGGVSKDGRTISVQSGIYNIPTTSILTPVYVVSSLSAAADISGFLWVWTKQ